MSEKGQLENCQNYLSEQKEFLSSLIDHLGRTLPLVAVEHDNLSFADYLLSAGFNPNISVLWCNATDYCSQL